MLSERGFIRVFFIKHFKDFSQIFELNQKHKSLFSFLQMGILMGFQILEKNNLIFSNFSTNNFFYSYNITIRIFQQLGRFQAIFSEI